MYTNHINPVAQKNQDAFCTALFQLLMKKPLEKISVTELCHMADLDRTTFYRSFESKDDVLDYYLDRQMTLLAGQLPAYSTLEKNLTALFRWTYAERKNLCILMDCHLTSFFSDALSEKIILVLISNIEFGDARQFVPWPVSLPGENRYFRNSFIGAYMGFSTAGAMETLQNDQRIWPNVWLRSIFTEEGETGWRTCGKRSCSQRMHLVCSTCRPHASPAGGTAMQSMRSSTTSAAPSSLKSRHQMHRKIPSEISDSTVRALRGFCVSRNGDQISTIPFSSFGIGSTIRRSTRANARPRPVQPTSR